MNLKITGLKKNVVYLGLVSFLTDVSSDMIYPILPLFLTEILGVTFVFIGLIEGIAEGTSSILKVVSGFWSDRVGKRKGLIIFGYSLSALGKPLLSVASAGWHVLLIRFLDRFGKGVRTSPRDALIADSVPDRKGIYFGLHRAMDSSGAMVGPLLAFLLLPLLNNNYRTLFLLATIPALLSVFVLIFFVKEKRIGMPLNDTRFKLKLSTFDRRFKLFLLVTLIFSLGNSTDAFLMLRAKDVGVGLAMLPLLWLVVNLVYTLFSIPAGYLSDRAGRKIVILFALLIYSLTYLGFAWANKTFQVWLLFAFYGLYYGFANGTMRAFVADLVPGDKKATAYGIFHGTLGFTALPASLIFGFLWQTMGASYAFLLGAVLAMIAGVILWLGL
jgi:MFS family permease